MGKIVKVTKTELLSEGGGVVSDLLFQPAFLVHIIRYRRTELCIIRLCFGIALASD